MAIRGSGELKIEFYAHLQEIKDLYFNQGIRVFKILHLKIVEKYSLTISYKMFCYYAKKELKIEHRSTITKEKNNIQRDIDTNQNEEKNIDIIIATPKFSKVQKFVPYNKND